MIIEKYYNQMLRIYKMFKVFEKKYLLKSSFKYYYLGSDDNVVLIKIFLAPYNIRGVETKNIFLYNKMNTDIKQGSQDHPNESSYPIATVIDKGLYEIYNSPIYRRIYKSSKFVYNVRKSD